MKTKLILSLILPLALLAFASPVSVYAIPTLPHAFYGDVVINDSPALDGTQISATVDVGDIVPVQNPVSTVGGSFGNPYLLVQGNIQNGAVITFYVTNENGTAIGGTYLFEIGGGPTPLVLSVTIAEPEPEPTPSPTPSAPPTVPHGTTDVRGMSYYCWCFLRAGNRHFRG